MKRNYISECHLPDYCILGNDAVYFGTGISDDCFKDRENTSQKLAERGRNM